MLHLGREGYIENVWYSTSILGITLGKIDLLLCLELVSML